MNKTLRTSMTALTLSVIALTAASPALADPPHRHGWKHDRGRGHDRDRWDDRDRRRGPDRVVVIRERDRRPPPRVVYGYDYNRPDPRYHGYYANRYYRGGGNYQPIRVTRETRVYRGSDDRYYCRRSDGTTGLIVGAALGGLLGDQLDRGRSSILGAVLGAGAGGLLGRSIERGEVNCR